MTMTFPLSESASAFPAPSASSPGLGIAAEASRGFVTYSPHDAPPAARSFLEATARQLGFVPEAVGRWAETPAVLKAFFSSLELWEQTSLTSIEREVVVMTVARENGCGLCQAMHTARLLAEAPREHVMALRAGTPTGDGRLDALAAFTQSLLQRKGDVVPALWEAFLEAGFTRKHALEVVLGVATTSLSTLANRLVEAPVDAPFAAFAPQVSL